MLKKYRHTMALFPQIKEMPVDGMTQKESENALGFTGNRPFYHLLNRERRKAAQGVSERQGRKPVKKAAGIRI